MPNKITICGTFLLFIKCKISKYVKLLCEQHAATMYSVHVSVYAMWKTKVHFTFTYVIYAWTIALGCRIKLLTSEISTNTLTSYIESHGDSTIRSLLQPRSQSNWNKTECIDTSHWTTSTNSSQSDSETKYTDNAVHCFIFPSNSTTSCNTCTESSVTVAVLNINRKKNFAKIH